MTKKRPLVIFSAAAVLLAVLASVPTQAQARHRHWRVRAGVGAVIAGAVLAEVLGATVDAQVILPPVSVRVQTYPPPVYYPPPPPPPPPPPVYYPPPAPVYAAPSVAYVQPSYQREYPRLGLALSGTLQSADAELAAVGGLAATLQLRTSRRTLLGLELQSLGAHRSSDDARRNDLAALVAGRVFLWNAALAPYLELAGGMGRTSLDAPGLRVRSSQLLARVGLGLEMRLGRHLFLDGQIAQLHRLHLTDHPDDYQGPDVALASAPFDQHERATEIRGGLGIRF